MEIDSRGWQPTVKLRWSLTGTLQQEWQREVGDFSKHWDRYVWHIEREWRDVPTQHVEFQTPVNSSSRESAL